MRALALGAILAFALGLAQPPSAEAPRERHRIAAERSYRRAIGHELHRLHRVQARLRAAVAQGIPEPLRHLARIAACESGGRPWAVSPGGTYRGMFQFDRSTWAGVGGSGDPAAAAPAEQWARALLLYAQRGAQPWPVCGRL